MSRVFPGDWRSLLSQSVQRHGIFIMREPCRRIWKQPFLFMESCRIERREENWGGWVQEAETSLEQLQWARLSGEWQSLPWRDSLAMQHSINPALERKPVTLMTTDGKWGTTWESRPGCHWPKVHSLLPCPISLTVLRLNCAGFKHGLQSLHAE